MPNAVKGEVAFRLSDGRSLTIVADHAALVRGAQAHTGKTKLAKFMADLQPLRDSDGEIVLDEDGDPAKDTMPATCALFYGMLDAHHPDLTLRDATNILIGDMDKVISAVTEGMELAFPDAKASAEGNAPKSQSQRGKSSGRNGAKSAKTTKRSGG